MLLLCSRPLTLLLLLPLRLPPTPPPPPPLLLPLRLRLPLPPPLLLLLPLILLLLPPPPPLPPILLLLLPLHSSPDTTWPSSCRVLNERERKSDLLGDVSRENPLFGRNPADQRFKLQAFGLRAQHANHCAAPALASGIPPKKSEHDGNLEIHAKPARLAFLPPAFLA